MGRPRVYDESLRERLITEARKMLTDDGYHGVSLRVLTRNVGTSTNAVYTLFGSKEALMAEVVIRDLDAMLGEDFSIEWTGDSKEDLANLARFYRQRATADPRAFAGTFEALEEATRPGSMTERMNPEVRNISLRLRKPIMELCERVAEEFKELNLDPEKMAVALWAVIHGFISLENAGALGLDPEQADAVFDQSVHSLYIGWVIVVEEKDDDGSDGSEGKRTPSAHSFGAVKVAELGVDSSEA